MSSPDHTRPVPAAPDPGTGSAGGACSPHEPPTRAARVLVVDDEAALVDALCDGLRDAGYDVAGYTDPAAALAAFRPGEFDIVLSDMMMPGIDGIRLLREALGADPGLVGVIMTGQGSIAAAVEAMRAGAFDFVLKPLTMRQVLPVVERAAAAHRLRAEASRLKREVERLEAERVRLLEEANARLAALATTDPLTGLANRRAFDETLDREARLAGRGTRPLSLLMLDVDLFKSFNDTFGHPAGDEVLRRVAEVVRTCCRGTDLAARIGGEEFAVLLPGTDGAGARTFAERVRRAVERGPWPLRPVTVSIGVAAFDPGCREAGRQLVAAADRGLYLAKQAGRNQVVPAWSDSPTGVEASLPAGSPG